MTEPHVVSALRAKRAEVSGHVADLERKLARHRASLATVEFLEPGEIAEFRIQMAPTSNLFRVGHRLGVEISSSNFPRFDRNLNTGEDIFTSTRMQVARQTVMHDQRYPSHLVVPVIPR